METVLRDEMSQWWEGFVKQKGLSQEWTNEGVTDEKSGESTEEGELIGTGIGDSGIKKTGRPMRLTKRHRELLSETRWNISKGVISYS